MSNATVPQTTTTPAHRLIGRTLIIQSSTNPRLSYTVTDRGCTCPAAKYRSGPCKHQQTRVEALAARAARPRMSDAEYTAACAAADELF